MNAQSTALAVLLGPLVLAVYWWHQKTRRSNQHKARRNSHQGRINQARRESPADLVIASAAFLAGELRLMPEPVAWPVANQLSAELSAAADKAAARTKGAHR